MRLIWLNVEIGTKTDFVPFKIQTRDGRNDSVSCYYYTNNAMSNITIAENGTTNMMQNNSLKYMMIWRVDERDDGRKKNLFKVFNAIN